MYLRQLIISLSILVCIILLQSLVAFWALKNSEFHTERSRIANQMLSEFISVRADKQRLKAWLAEYLVTAQQNTDFRNILLERMQQQLSTLDQLATHKQLFNTNAQDQQYTLQQTQTIALLQANLNTLSAALKTANLKELNQNESRWQLLAQLFDTFQGTDLAELLQQAITQQKQRASQTELDALNALKKVQHWMIAISVFGLIAAIVLGIHLWTTLKQALERLATGTLQLQQGNFTHKIPEQSPIEFAELARQFNRMASHLGIHEQEKKQAQQATEQLVLARTAQLEQAIEQLHQAELRQKQLMADISHELRTPTTTILGEAEIVLRGDDKAIAIYQETLQRIIATCQQLNRRIDDLLMLARGEERLLRANLARVGLVPCYQDIIQQLEQQLSSLPFTLHHEIKAIDIAKANLEEDPETEKAQDYTTYYLLIDPEKLSVVIRIITDNALQYSGSSQKLVLCFIVGIATLKIQLIDFGLGLTAQDTHHVFQRHYRGQAARHSRPEGLGIGLCIAKAIMEAQDGSISLSMNKPTGTIVELNLPLFNERDNEDFNY